MTWTRIVDLAGNTPCWTDLDVREVYIEADAGEAMQVFFERFGERELGRSEVRDGWQDIREATCFARGGYPDKDEGEWVERPDPNRNRVCEVTPLEEFLDREWVEVIQASDIDD